MEVGRLRLQTPCQTLVKVLLVFQMKQGMVIVSIEKAIGNARVDGKNFFQVILLMEFSDLT